MNGTSPSTTRRLVAPSFPARSTARNARKCLPTSLNAIGEEYGVQAPPSIEYSIRATPDPLSVALSSTRAPTGSWTLPPAIATPAWRATAVGGVMSIRTLVGADQGDQMP